MIEHGIVEALHKAQAAKDPKAIAQTEALASVLKAVKLDGFQDVALPQAPKETAPVEVKRFTDEAREALQKEGYRIHQLTGESIRTLRSGGRKFLSTWHQEAQYEGFETLGSMHSELAIQPDPEKFLLHKSNNSTLEEQLEMIAEYSHTLQRKLRDQALEAIMGEAPDYSELAFVHLDATGVRLFGENYGYNYARTKTPTVGSHVALVGRFDAAIGLYVLDWHRGLSPSRVFASPLVVPKS